MTLTFTQWLVEWHIDEDEALDFARHVAEQGAEAGFTPEQIDNAWAYLVEHDKGV